MKIWTIDNVFEAEKGEQILLKSIQKTMPKTLGLCIALIVFGYCITIVNCHQEIKQKTCAQSFDSWSSDQISLDRFKRDANNRQPPRLRSRQLPINSQGSELRIGAGNQTAANQIACSNYRRQVSARRIKRQKYRCESCHYGDEKQTTSEVNPCHDDRRQQYEQDHLSQPKVIETAVFIDQALDNKFNGISNGLVELNKLVLTMMHQVQLLFKYKSLHVPITLKLVRVEHLKGSERQYEGLQAPDSARGDIDIYLENFCSWQHKLLERDQRLWWDHAILLTGLDLYKATRAKNHSGVLGLAWVGGMCNSSYSCTINEAPNFEAPFVIAHELGHSLGIMHDGQKNRCEPNGFIMSEHTGAGKIHWSSCSNKYLNDSILKGRLTCLDTERNDQIDSLYDLTKLRQPGQVYTINDQCRLAFGNNHTSFVTNERPYNAVCRELWCVAGSIARPAHPALEGSSCGDNDRVCYEGRCV